MSSSVVLRSLAPHAQRCDGMHTRIRASLGPRRLLARQRGIQRGVLADSWSESRIVVDLLRQVRHFRTPKPGCMSLHRTRVASILRHGRWERKGRTEAMSASTRVPLQSGAGGAAAPCRPQGDSRPSCDHGPRRRPLRRPPVVTLLLGCMSAPQPPARGRSCSLRCRERPDSGARARIP